jgi:hypothetical protein
MSGRAIPHEKERVLQSRPMRSAVFFFGYFWFSHRTGGGEASL